MKEILVSLEVAKLAKEKGFNLKVYGFYKGEELVLENQLTDVVLGIDDILYNYNKNNSVSAPTQSLLQKWLREVHNIHVGMYPQIPITNKYAFELVSRSHQKLSRLFNNHEEALETGLQEALKLIPNK